MTAWFVSEYEHFLYRGQYAARRPLIDTLAFAIAVDGGRWSEAEIEGDRCIVAVEGASAATLALIAQTKGLAVLPDRAAAAALWAPRKKERIAGGKIVPDGEAMWTKTVAALETEVARPFVSRTKPLRSGPKGGAVLDDGTGTNASPVAGNWSGPVLNGAPQLRRVSNAFAPVSEDGQSYWNAVTFSDPCEVFAKATTLGGPSYFVVLLCIATPGTSGVDLYWVGIDNNVNALGCYRVTNNAFTQLGSDITFSPANGDSLGCSLESGVLELWIIDASVDPALWVSKGTRSEFHLYHRLCRPGRQRHDRSV